MAESGISQLVVIGSSAGGIDALSTLVGTLPTDFPAPLVLAQHLDPARPSHLTEILSRRSALPVREVTDQVPLQNGVIFVVPANHDVAITDHAIGLRVHDTRVAPSVDLLLTSAAEVFGENLIAVILTGAGSDGAAGARAVKQAGGMVVVQNPQTAQFPGMPGAIAPPLVDVVAEIEAIGPLLRDLLMGTYVPSQPAENPALRALLTQLHDVSGIDFAQYKAPTIQRRLQRRMAATGQHRLGDYLAYLQTHPEEFERLVGSFLIKVTEFFRDPDLFAYLSTQTLPELIATSRRHEYELRLWSAGCATGEEAYSLAIAVAEALGDELERFNVRIFATDLDSAAIAYARRGIYPATALGTLDRAVVARYFTRSDGGYEVSKRVRALVVFGEHDLGQRAPFPRIDLCMCRNVLIYFTPDLQRRALQLFAFAVRDGGYLALGKAETPSIASDFFVPVHPQLRLYRRQGARLVLPVVPLREPVPLRPRPSVGGRGRSQSLASSRGSAEAPRLPTSIEIDAALLRTLPIGVVVVDQRYDIQTINTAAERLLGIHGPALGEDLVHLTERLPAPGLRAALDAALAGRAEQEVLAEGETPRGEQRVLQLTCHAFGAGEEGGTAPQAERRALVLVTDVTAASVAARGRAATQAAELRTLQTTHARLHEEMNRVEARMQRLVTTNAELEAANARLGAANLDLRRANEEFVVGAEELQAAMEEVETLNEEMQATNEELETLNEELQATVEELNTTNGDLEARSIELQTLVMEREEQRQLSESERARLAAVLLSIGEAVLVVDRNGTVVLTNAAVERLFGAAGAAIAPEDAEGQPLAPEESPRVRAARGETFNMTFTLPSYEGTRRWFEATGSPITPEGGVVVIRDITDRSLRRVQEEFLALASHELRTPLTPIQGYLQLLGRLLQIGGDSARARRYLGLVQEHLRNLQRLIEDLLDVGRLQEGKLTLRRDPVDLVALVQSLAEAVQVTTPEPPLQLDLPPGPLVVQGDTTRLSQVLLNLLNNAARYAPQSPQIVVRLQRDNSTAVLEVQDEGPGIPERALPHLFERFYRASENSGHGGLGVGLYVTRELVRAHGGEIAVQSEEGAGTTVSVRLPLDGQAAAEPIGDMAAG
jgi:two-component system CheB/CheR fusion protein